MVLFKSASYGCWDIIFSMLQYLQGSSIKLSIGDFLASVGRKQMRFFFLICTFINDMFLCHLLSDREGRCFRYAWNNVNSGSNYMLNVQKIHHSLQGYWHLHFAYEPKQWDSSVLHAHCLLCFINPYCVNDQSCFSWSRDCQVLLLNQL